MVSGGKSLAGFSSPTRILLQPRRSNPQLLYLPWPISCSKVILLFLSNRVSHATRRLNYCLMLKGCSKLIEREEALPGDIPMFRTGLGKSVPLKESSMAKAKSLLADSGTLLDTIEFP